MTTEAYAGASPDAVQHHYDVGNAFYALWLDETMTYSCALWATGDTLEQAQSRKLDYLIDASSAAGAHRVLDIGCGWGSLLERLVDVHGVDHVTGLTLSPAQAEAIAARADERIEVHIENWVEHSSEEPYDAIISIGAFEHFARFGLPRCERIAAYRRFFRRCRELLPPGSRFALQTIAKGGNIRLDRRAARELRFVADRIFPESELPWASEVLEASEKLFELVSVRNDAGDYARTCGAWLGRLRASRKDAMDLVGAQTVDDYERYLNASVEHFRNGHLALLRCVYQRT